jgi:putative transposase
VGYFIVHNEIVHTRRRLPHTPPDFVAAGAIFFITVCTHVRGENRLANDSVWPTLREATAHYHNAHRWYVRVLLAMPDHVHLLASFPKTERIDRVVAAWKHFTNHRADVTWQRGFFDHRLRQSDSLDEKSTYIRMNPVRAGLVNTLEQWRYVWAPSELLAMPQ